MPETPQLPTTPDPLASLRAGVDAHRQSVDAARQVGAQLRSEPPQLIDTTETHP
jgi:hypothetical protein